MKQLIVCHGKRHEPHFKNADTLDVSSHSNPTYVGDLTDPSLKLPSHAYKRVVLQGCPNFVLFRNAPRAIVPIFQRPGDTMPADVRLRVEQELETIDEDSVVFDVVVRGDELVAAKNVSQATPRLEGWFRYKQFLYSNYTILNIALQPIEHTWLNLYSCVSQHGEIVVKAPMPRMYAMMHAVPHTSFRNALISLTNHIAKTTGVPLRFKKTILNNAFAEYVTPVGARFTNYEGYDWYMEPIPVTEHFLS